MGVDKSLVYSVLLLFLQTHCCWGQSKMIVPSQPIIVPVGSDVTLPCEVDPVKNLKDLVVEWSRPDLKPRYIHIRRDGLDLLTDQNSLYQGRTRLWERGLQIGDMSLQLSRVRLSDGGTYRCYVPQMDTAGEVTLRVVSVSPVSVSLTKDHSGSPVLRCESRGWYPEPELVWLDSDGTVLTGGRTEVQPGVSDETFSVSSRLSVEQSSGNTFICRVRQQETRQSTETQITITGEFLEACPSCSVAWTLFVLGLLAAAAAGAYFLWKYKIRKPESVVTKGKEEDGEQSKPMLPKSPTKAHGDKQKLSEYEEALSRISEEMHFIEESDKLLGSKEFLLRLKDTLNRCNHDLSTDIEVKKEKLKASLLSSSFSDKNKEREKQIEKNESQIKTFTDIMNLTHKEIGKIDEIVRKSTERKGKLKEEHKQMTKLWENEKKRLEAAAQSETQQVSREEVKVNVDEMDLDALCADFGKTQISSQCPVNSEDPTQVDEVREEQSEKSGAEKEPEEQPEETEAEEGGATSVGANDDSAVKTKKKKSFKFF